MQAHEQVTLMAILREDALQREATIAGPDVLSCRQTCPQLQEIGIYDFALLESANQRSPR